MTEPLWLTEEIVIAMHNDQVQQHGGLTGIRDDNLLSASLARPQHLYQYGTPTLFDLAAAYGFGLVKNYAFVDGNKRTAFVVMATFLEVNGYSLNAPEPEVVSMMERLSTDKENQESLATWLREHC